MLLFSYVVTVNIFLFCEALHSMDHDIKFLFKRKVSKRDLTFPNVRILFQTIQQQALVYYIAHETSYLTRDRTPLASMAYNSINSLFAFIFLIVFAL